MIHEALAHGAENARTARELAQLFDCGVRDVTQAIERERRAGKPICAATGENPGYYLASTAQELEEYCRRLQGRAREITRTRRALLKVLKQITAQQAPEKEADQIC